MVMEAMLRGVPVLASDMGSLIEAKAGTNYILPVTPIKEYKAVFDENRMPEPIVPEQDVEPWAKALEELMENADLYAEECRAAREAANRFVPTVEASLFEEYLLKLKPASGAEKPADTVAAPARSPRLAEGLTPEKRALLLKRLRRRAGKD